MRSILFAVLVALISGVALADEDATTSRAGITVAIQVGDGGETRTKISQGRGATSDESNDEPEQDSALALLKQSQRGEHLGTKLFFGTGLVIVAIVFAFLWLRERGRIELARALVEHGKELPPQLLTPSRAPRQRGSDLRRGIVLLMLGAGLAASFLLSGYRDHWAFALVPGFLGLGYLLVWRMERSTGEHGKQ